MKRRSFIKLVSIIGAGACVSPNSLFGKSSHRIELPACIHHVRHGGWNDSEVPKPLSNAPKWLSDYQQNRYFKNGLEASKDDLMVTEFKLGGELIQLTQVGTRMSLNTKQTPHFEVSIFTDQKLNGQVFELLLPILALTHHPHTTTPVAYLGLQAIHVQKNDSFLMISKRG